MITGRLRVLVGGDVVVVVVGGDVVGDADPELTPESDAPGVEVLGVEVVGVSAGAGEDPPAPGCSFATTTPMAMVAPAASNAAARVRRRTRASARPRPLESWVAGWSSLVTSSDQHHFMEAAARSIGLRSPCGYSVNPAQSDQRGGVEAPFHPMEGDLRQNDERPPLFSCVGG